MVITFAQAWGRSVRQETAAERRAAFAVMARQYEGDLLRVARRLHRGDDDRAQDLVQDALVRAYEAYLKGLFHAGSNGRAWLLRIVTNLYINDYTRRRKWESGIDLDTLTASGEVGPSETRAAPADTPGVALLESTLDEPLETALATLSEGLRLCVILVDMQGLDYAETAAALNIPIGTVRSRLARARVQLYAKLVEYGRQRRLL